MFKTLFNSFSQQGISLLQQLSPGQSIINNPINPLEFDLSNPNRPLQSNEARQMHMHWIVTMVGLCEQLDFSRATLVINYLNKIYSFLASKVVVDERRKWLFYQESPSRKYQFDQSQLEILKSFEDFDKLVHNGNDKINANQMSVFEILKIEIPQLPLVNYGISISIHHAMIDGSSCAALLRRFNELYSDSTIDFELNPVKVQKSPFCPLCALPKNFNLSFLKQNPAKVILPEHSKLTGGTFDLCSLKQPYDWPRFVSLVDKQLFPKIPDVNHSIMLYSISTAVGASYGYYNHDITEEFIMQCGDVRLLNDFFQQQCPELDMKDYALGFTVSGFPLFAKGTKDTTILQIAKQYQFQLSNRVKLTDEQTWQQFIRMGGVQPIDLNVYGMVGNFLVSNVGRANLGEGVIKQMLACTSNNNMGCSFDTGGNKMGGQIVINGVYGTFVIGGTVRNYSDEENKIIRNNYFKILEIVRERGAENVTIGSLMSLWDGFKK